MRYYINVSVPEDVYRIYQSIPQGQRGWIIGRLLRAWYQAGQKGLLPSTKEPASIMENIRKENTKTLSDTLFTSE
jgi:hypothetical protein